MGLIAWFFFWYFVLSSVFLAIWLIVINIGRHQVYCCYCGEDITDDDNHTCEKMEAAKRDAIMAMRFKREQKN